MYLFLYFYLNSPMLILLNKIIKYISHVKIASVIPKLASRLVLSSHHQKKYISNQLFLCHIPRLQCQKLSFIVYIFILIKIHLLPVVVGLELVARHMWLVLILGGRIPEYQIDIQQLTSLDMQLFLVITCD